jgi:hypothetical protein
MTAIQMYNNDPRNVQPVMSIARKSFTVFRSKNQNDIALSKLNKAILLKERSQALAELNAIDIDQYENQPSLIIDDAIDEQLEAGRQRKQLTDEHLTERENKALEDAKNDRTQSSKSFELESGPENTEMKTFIDSFMSSISGVSHSSDTKPELRTKKTQAPMMVDDRLYESDEKESSPPPKKGTKTNTNRKNISSQFQDV